MMETIEQILDRYKAIRKKMYPTKVVNRALEFRPKPQPKPVEPPQPKPQKEIDFPVLINRTVKTYKIFIYGILPQDHFDPQSVKWQEIVDHVCQKYSLKPVALWSQRREPKYIQARHEVWQLAAALTGYSLPKMGRLSSRDHTTVLYGIRKPHDIKVLVSEFVKSINK